MIPAVLERVAGIDVHKKFLTVCVMMGPAYANPEVKKRKFGTLNAEVEELRAWLRELDCQPVVMESTGSYWKPVFNILDDGWFQVTLANPQQVKNLRGHKTDMKDCVWLAHLHRHGMIRASYIPPRAVRELRDLTRRRKQLIRNAADERNRIQKLLEEANVKLGNVLTDVLGASGTAILVALIQGQTSPEQMARLAKPQARKKIPQIQAALEGNRLTAAHRALLQQGLEHLAFLDEQIQQMEDSIQRKISASGFAQVNRRLQTVTALKADSAAVVLAEIGPDVRAFPNSKKLTSWAGVCPGNNESGGKRKSGRTTKGNPYLRDMLLEVAWGSSHKKNSAQQQRYLHLTPRKGHKRAILAVAHATLRAVYWVLSTGQDWVDQSQSPDTRQTSRLIRHHTRRLRRLRCILHPSNKKAPLELAENQELMDT